MAGAPRFLALCIAAAGVFLLFGCTRHVSNEASGSKHTSDQSGAQVATESSAIPQQKSGDDYVGITDRLPSTVLSVSLQPELPKAGDTFRAIAQSMV